MFAQYFITCLFNILLHVCLIFYYMFVQYFITCLFNILLHVCLIFYYVFTQYFIACSISSWQTSIRSETHRGINPLGQTRRSAPTSYHKIMFVVFYNMLHILQGEKMLNNYLHDFYAITNIDKIIFNSYRKF